MACSHRWFTWPVPRGIPPVGSYPTLSPITCAVKRRVRHFGPSAGLLSVALDVAAGLRRAAPRVLSPSGLSGPGYPPGPHESGLCSASRAKPRNTATGRTAQTSLNYTLLRQVLGSMRLARAPPCLRRTILVGVRRSSTLSVALQRFRQRESSPTAGSNQMPGPSGSITPS